MNNAKPPQYVYWHTGCRKGTDESGKYCRWIGDKRYDNCKICKVIKYVRMDWHKEQRSKRI